MEGYDRQSKYGTRRIALTDVPHPIDAHTIEVVTAATFTLLQERGVTETGAAVAQVETVTLTGTSGTANITVAGGLTKLATWNTSLTQTATDFVTAHAAAYKLADIILTSSGADLIFTAAIVGTAIAVPVITNATGDLAGTVAHTTANKITSMGNHGIYGEITVGEKIHAATRFTSVMISGGVILVY